MSEDMDDSQSPMKRKTTNPKDLLESLKKVSLKDENLPQLKKTEHSEDGQEPQDIMQSELGILSDAGVPVDPQARAQAVSQIQDFLKMADGMLAVEPAPQAPVQEVDPNAPTGVIWNDLQIFFRQLAAAYSLRYEMWENFYTTIMNILGKVYKVNKENSDKLILGIENVHVKLTEGLEKFMKKRDEVERYAEIEFKQIAKNLRKTLNLLALQLKAFKLNEIVNQIYNIYVPK